VVANCDHLSRLKFSPAFPYAFTEHGAIMAASVLNTPRAIEVSIFVVRAFVKLREMLATHKDLRTKIEDMVKKYDHQFQIVFEAIKQLLETEAKPRKKNWKCQREGGKGYVGIERDLHPLRRGGGEGDRKG